MNLLYTFSCKYLPSDVYTNIFTAPSISNMAGLEPGTVHIPSSTRTQSSAGEASSSGTSSTSDSGSVKGKRPKLPSFWIPTLTPSAKPTEIKKPVSKISHIHDTSDQLHSF